MKNLICLLSLSQSLTGSIFGYNAIMNSNDSHIYNHIYVDVNYTNKKNEKVIDHLEYNNNGYRTLGKVLENEAPINEKSVCFQFQAYGEFGHYINGYVNSNTKGINNWSVWNFGIWNNIKVNDQNKWNNNKNYSNYGIDSIKLTTSYFGIKENN